MIVLLETGESQIWAVPSAVLFGRNEKGRME